MCVQESELINAFILQVIEMEACGCVPEDQGDAAPFVLPSNTKD